jgi:regulator of Ty1 transposition protein 103
LIYLCNEVVQQSRAKKREEFLSAFARVIPGALGLAYKAVSNEVRGKIKRVVDVWRQRSIFSEGVLYKIEGQLHHSSGASGNNGGGNVGGSKLSTGKLNLGDAFGTDPEIPPSLVKLASAQKDLTAAVSASTTAKTIATKQYTDLFDGNTLPEPKEYARLLDALSPLIATAVRGVDKSISARRELLAQLQSLVSSNEALLREELKTARDLKEKAERVVETKTEIESMIAEEEGTAALKSNQERTPPLEPSAAALSFLAGLNLPQPNAAAPKGGAPGDEEYRPQPFVQRSTAPPKAPANLDAPAYSPLSSDSESDNEEAAPAAADNKRSSDEVSANGTAEPEQKKTKMEGDETETPAPAEEEYAPAAASTLASELTDTPKPTAEQASTTAPTGLEALDPKVAQFLSNLVQKNASSS